MDQAKAQKYWDACLIKQWRLCGTIGDTFEMYKSITQKYPAHDELIRLPWFLHRSIGVRVYVDKYLPKVSDLLWKLPAEKDVALLNKLTKSKYDNDKKHATNSERELKKAKYSNKVSTKKMEYTQHQVTNRNAATDWNVTKSAKAK